MRPNDTTGSADRRGRITATAIPRQRIAVVHDTGLSKPRPGDTATRGRLAFLARLPRESFKKKAWSDKKTKGRKNEIKVNRCHWKGCTMEDHYEIEEGFSRMLLPDGWDRVPSHWSKSLVEAGLMQPEGWLVCPEHAEAVEKRFS